MGIKINQYPLERLTFGDEDFYDIDYWDGATYQTAKIKGSTIKAGIESGVLTIYDNDGTLTGARTVDMNNFSLGFTGGSVGIEHDLTVFSNDPTKQWVATFIASSTNAVLAVQNTQENVGIGTSAPATCSKLEVDSTDKGILIPRMTTTQRNAISGIEESLMIYNIDTNQFEYVDSSLNWVALGGGDSIYTADGILSGNRIVDIGSSNTLTFKNDGTASNFRIDVASNGYTLFNRSGGIKVRPLGGGNEPIVITNTTETLDTFTVKKNGGGSWSAYNGVKIGELSTNDFAQFTIDDLDFYKANVLLHRIGFGTNGSDIDFWINGASANNSFRIGGSNLIDLESISLKGKTIIQGEDTLSTSTALAIYDGDATPNKLWDFKNDATLIGSDGAKIEDVIIVPTVQETASTASFTIDADNETMGVLTGMTQNVNVEAPTGIPVQGQKLMLRFKDDGTTRNFTWNVIWRAIGVTLPTATTANKTLYVGAVYNSTDSKWDVIAVKEEA